MKKLIILASLALFAVSCADQLKGDEPKPEQTPGQTQEPAAEPEVADSTVGQPTDSLELLPNSPYQLDSLALVALYESTNGDNWVKYRNNWKTAPMHRWYGVKTEKIDGIRRVVSLRLVGMNLQGSIPAQLGQLTHLRNLNFIGNEGLVGSIPDSIYHLTDLEVLNLSDTRITGGLSSKVAQLQKLDSLALRKGYQSPEEFRLTGPIPASICSMKNLRYLNLDNNAFSGPIPENIGQMESLENLQLWCNKLSGTIPESIGQMANLQIFFGASNALSGSIPASIGNMSSIREIYLDNNNLSGSIPESIGLMSTIRDLDLGHNNLTGSIPATITNLKQIGIFRANDNALSGTLPVGICNMNPMLVVVRLENNNLTGQIPVLTGFHIGMVAEPWYCQLVLKGNKMSGDIPAWLIQFPSDCRKNLIPQQSGFGFDNESLL